MKHQLELHPQVAGALASETIAEALARDPGLQPFSHEPEHIVHAVAAQRVLRGLAVAPGVAAPRAPRAAEAPRPSAPKPKAPKRPERTPLERAIELAARCRASEEPLLDADTVRELQARFPSLDFRSKSERRGDSERGATLDAQMGLAAPPQGGVHFDPATNVQTFGGPAPIAEARPVRVGDPQPHSPEPVVQRLDEAFPDAEPRTKIGVRTEGVVQSFGVPVPAETEPEAKRGRLAPAVLAAAAADDKRMRFVGGKWVLA